MISRRKVMLPPASKLNELVVTHYKQVLKQSLTKEHSPPTTENHDWL